MGENFLKRISCYTWSILLFLTSVLALGFSLLVTWAASGIVRPIILIPGFLKLQLSENPGIAFSINIPSPWKEVLIISALTAVCIVAVRSKPGAWASVGFGLIIGGALGNVIDRIPDGLVTDYVSAGSFPIFNAADSCITIGAALLMFDGLKKGKTEH